MKRFVKVSVSFVAGALLVCLIGSVTWSKIYWGYYFRPPAVDSAYSDIASVVTMTKYFRFNHQPSAKLYRPKQEITWAYQNRQPPLFPESPSYRLLYVLDQSSLLPDIPNELPESRVKALVDQLNIDTDYLYGVLIEAKDKAGVQCILFSGTTFPLDHRGYCEVIAEETTGGILCTKSSVSFNFDTAGLEGATWLQVFLASACWIVPLALVLACIVCAVPAILMKYKKAHQSDEIKTSVKRVYIALGITVLILAPGLLFVTAVRFPMAEGIGMSEAENIRHLTKFRIVSPDWITPGEDGLYWKWMKAESISRLLIVVATWFLALIFINPDKWCTGKPSETKAEE